MPWFISLQNSGFRNIYILQTAPIGADGDGNNFESPALAFCKLLANHLSWFEYLKSKLLFCGNVLGFFCHYYVISLTMFSRGRKHQDLLCLIDREMVLQIEDWNFLHNCFISVKNKLGKTNTLAGVFFGLITDTHVGKKQ